MSDFNRKNTLYMFEYEDDKIVIISPTGKRKYMDDEDKLEFIGDVDYVIEHETAYKTANDAVSDLICRKYSKYI